MSEYKTVWQACGTSATMRPVFATLEEAEEFLREHGYVDSGESAYTGHPDNEETRYWVDLDNDDLPDRYTRADLAACVGDGAYSPQIRPIAVQPDFEPAGKYDWQPNLPEVRP